ncbi:tRNA (adenosine(37)-N6)-threonylcarbamoyltransferase complex transferase subunit TsaD [Buchnera aphidicola]|uniref:tRNA (adenosine(37)-N6)-threonylcarbamoyltransferase complex transferase subunit TsaD n=1 Tax=Buchnera aphidicola TaxID=9 RepID=UPI00346495F6
MRILGVETSFDDVGIAIYDSHYGILVNVLNSQCIHNQYGGVVPELAAREYINQLAPLIKNILRSRKISMKTIDGIAYTAGPGLSGSLLVGACVSCALAYACNIPAIPINHMEGHLLSPMLEDKNVKFPLIALLISGKHTQLISASKIGKYELLGETLDDAVGEVFDKIAKELNLGYPGGAILSDFATYGNLGKFTFPKPMKYHKNFNFSFSGLKTFTLNLIRSKKHDLQDLYDIACSFEDSILDVLVYKSLKAMKKKGFKRLLIAGGVSANKKLRNRLKNILEKNHATLYFSSSNFCTDNAAMIAYTGMVHYTKKYKTKIIIRPNWRITDL